MTTPAKRKRAESIEESCLELKYLDLNNYDTVGAFKTPSLRNLKKTAPYMHHGIYRTLDEVIKYYDEANTEPAVGHKEESIQPIGLSDLQKKQLKAFLNSLTPEVHEAL